MTSNSIIEVPSDVFKAMTSWWIFYHKKKEKKKKKKIIIIIIVIIIIIIIIIIRISHNVSFLGSNDIIIDMLSVERNYVLVRTYLVGGPSERILPSRTLQQDGMNPYPQPIFSSYPVPREYIPNIAGRSALKQGKSSIHIVNNHSPLASGNIHIINNHSPLASGNIHIVNNHSPLAADNIQLQ